MNTIAFHLNFLLFLLFVSVCLDTVQVQLGWGLFFFFHYVGPRD